MKPIRSVVAGTFRVLTVATVVALVIGVSGGAVMAQTATTVYDDPNSPYEPSDRVVALTFDDGPSPDHTADVLRILRRYAVPATFFIVGQWASEHPELVEAAHERRHTVANHTWSHPQDPHLPDLSDAQIRQEIGDTRDLISDITGQGPPIYPSCMRPTGGQYDERVVSIASELGYRTALWTVDTEDWTSPGADAIVQAALDGLEPGAVILMHDGPEGREQTVQALPRIIEGIQQRGYEIVPWCRPPPPFPDIWEGGVHAANIERIEARGITDGVGHTGEYRPDDIVDRGQMATFLWRVAGRPTGYPDHGFPDVPDTEYYADAVRWLAAEGITDGVGHTGEYRPEDEVTRGQIATFLWRMQGEPTGYPDHGFADVSPDDYYDDAVRWMTAEDITDGYHDGFSPATTVPRDQTASFLMRTFPDG